MEYDLSCNYDSRKSFYGKARVREENGKTVLISYSTEVAYIENGQAVVNGMHSNTTLRHIKEFLLQNGFNAVNWAQIEKDYSESKEQAEAKNKASEEKFNSEMNTVKTVAMLGDLFGNNQKESNDWKARMLKAGLEPKGLIMPDDWETLSEDEKEKRLNHVLEVMK